MDSPKDQSICVIGTGPAGLITAHTLLQDGFKNVEIITRDRSPGGVWAKDKVYPGLTINNVHGEFRFSSLPMPPPLNAKATGGRLSGQDLQTYMESFADRFLEGKIRYNTEVINVRRRSDVQVEDRCWSIAVRCLTTSAACDVELLNYDKVVLCTGVCDPRVSLTTSMLK